MAFLERSIQFDGPCSALEAVALNPARIPEWYAGVQHAEPDGVFPQPGGTVKLTYQAADLTFHIDLTMLDHQPGEFILLRLDGMIQGISQWDISPEGHRLRLTCSYQYDFPWGAVSDDRLRAQAEQINAHNLAQSLTALIALVEAEKANAVRRAT